MRRRIKQPQAAHPAVGKLAVALKAYKEAVEQQAATADILRALSRASGNPQPVFEAVVKHAHRLCDGAFSILYAFDGSTLSVVADSQSDPRASKVLRSMYPAPANPGHIVGRTVLDGKTISSADVSKDPRLPASHVSAHTRFIGLKSAVAVPLRGNGSVIGALAVGRLERRPFTNAELRLLGTFADQAQIAMENVRLFNETAEALEHQKASSDVLRIVAGSVESTDPVFRAITEAGMRLVPGVRVGLYLVRDDGKLDYAAHSGIKAEARAALARLFPMKLDRKTIAGCSILERRTQHVPDIATTGRRYASSLTTSKVSGWRALLAVPLVRDGQGIGAVVVTRPEPGPFTDRQIALITAFADQALIALRNAASFREINERNDELKQALDFQGATAEILASISGSMADTQPVFDAIVRNLLRLLGTQFAAVQILKEGQIHMAALGCGPRDRALFKRIAREYPRPLDESTTTGRAMLAGKVVHFAGLSANAAAPAATRSQAQAFGGYESIISAPMILDGRVIGGIVTARREPAPFDDKQVALIKAFADQAVIAIENARLFNETKEALERQTSTADVLRVISSTPTDTQPVFDAIVQSAQRLLGGKSAILLLRRDREAVVAGYSAPGLEEIPAHVRAVPLDRERNFPSRVILDREVLNIPDWAGDEVIEFERLVARAYGIGSGLQVPLLRKGEGIGVLIVTRETKGAFHDKEVELLRSFADQAVIAIENVRLFNETRESLERQTATAEILRVIAGSPSDVQPVFETVAENAARLCAANSCVVTRFDGELVHLAAVRHETPEAERAIRGAFPTPLSGRGANSRAIMERAIVHMPDVRQDADYVPGGLAEVVKAISIVAVPLLVGDKAVGAIGVSRPEPRPFTPQHIALLKTFADQASIAIENVRLFNETKEALERQTATAEILKVIASSPSDVQPVFDAIAKAANRLVDGFSVAVLRVVDEQFHLAAITSTGKAGDDSIRKYFPRPIDSLSPGIAAAVRTRAPSGMDDVQTDPGVPEQTREVARARGFRGSVAVPMLRGDEVLGVINVTRAEPGRFSDHQIELLKTFADQAVIAIENVRLFNETKESLERQTATAEVLRVISASPTDVQPVFQAIAEAAMRLFGAWSVAVCRYDGELMHFAAACGALPDTEAYLRSIFPTPANPDTVAGQAIVQRGFVELADATVEGTPQMQQLARLRGYRAVAATAMLRDGRPIGSIAVSRQAAGRLSAPEASLLRSFADQAVIAIENVRLFNETKEALERQTATSEILGVISRSQTDVQPVFDTIAESALKLCRAKFSVVSRYDGKQLHLAAIGNVGDARAADAIRAIWPHEPGPTSAASRAIQARKVIEIEDILEDADYGISSVAKKIDFRSVLAVPMMRGGVPMGVIGVQRDQPGRFPEDQVALLKTFADQAVIAIENVRLFNETKEALERQTASGEILGAISSSIADAKPVFDRIARSCERLFGSDLTGVTVVGSSGRIELAAYHGPNGEALNQVYPLPLSHESGTGSAILDAVVKHFPDIEAPGVPPGVVAGCRTVGMRAIVFAPLISDGRGIGAMWVGRRTAGAFSGRDIALLKTFADQAVIAIRNAQMFNETKESLEQQTATSEILKVISSSPTDTQPVFDAIVRSAAELFAPCSNGIVMREGELLHLRAAGGAQVNETTWADLAKMYPIPFDPEKSLTVRAILERRAFQCEDIEAPGVPEQLREAGRAAGFRFFTTVPLVRDDEGIGAISLTHPEPGYKLSDKQLALLRTFADQAVIAIENVRLFNETKESLEQQTAISDVLRVISASPTDVKPVLRAVAERAARICEANDARIFILDGSVLRMAGGYGDLDTDPDEAVPVEGSFMGRAVSSRAAQQVDLAVADADLFPLARKRYHQLGHRVLLAAPLLREDRVVGTVLMRRKEGQLFSDKHIALLKTFADQAAIAIENVRLFNETKEALEQQKASAEVLAVISSSISDASPVFNKILQSCQQLFAGKLVGINVVGEDGQVHSAAYEGVEREAFVAMFPFQLDRNSGTGLAVLERRVVHVPDIDAEGVPEWARRGHRLSGTRAGVFAPLVWEGRGIGAIFIAREEAGPFTDKEIALLQSFANQAAIAIQNARLFREIQDKSRQLEEASRHKSQFLASMSHELRTPLNAILGFNEMILGQIYGEVPADMREPLTDIQTSGKHLLRLINNVLDLAKIEAGRMELALADYSVHDAVAGVQATLRPLAAEKGLELVATLPDDLPLAYGDSGRLTQCLMNLAGNSLKFTKSGRVEIAVVLKADGLLRWSVSDTGIGIPPDKIGTLFTEFKQTDATIASEYGGTGLGLSITKKFIEMHGGRIWVESELGKGSSFIFEIPVRVQT